MEVTLDNGISLKLNENNHTAIVTGSSSDQSSILIPKFITHQSKNFLIKSIGEGSFKNNKKIKSILFPEDSELSEIGKKAFLYSSLENIKIPPHVTQIEKESFSYCENLKDVTFSKDSELQIIKDDSFSFSLLESIEIPSSVTFLGSKSFAECSKLKSITIPLNSKLHTISRASFSFTQIESLFIPSKVEVLENGWCANMSKLVNVFVSPMNKRFSVYENKFIVGKIDEKSEFFDSLVFACRDVEKVVIPSHIKRIEAYCFDECNHFKTIEFSPNSQLTTIDKYSFYNTSIESITIPSKVEKIGELAFFECSSLKTINFSDDSELRVIEKGAFIRTSIESLSLQSKVEMLDEGWDCSTSKLVNVFVSPMNKRFSVYENKFIVGKIDEKSEFFDSLVFACRDVEKVVIPSHIKRIEAYCFDECNHFKTIEFSPNSQLTTIDKYSFYNTSIERIVIPSLVNKIEKRAFFCCYNLKSVTFLNKDSETIKEVYPEAFQNCSTLRSIEFLGNEFHLGYDLFDECYQLLVISFPDSKRVEIGIDLNIASKNFSLFVSMDCEFVKIE